jgi:predicted phage tail protein
MPALKRERVVFDVVLLLAVLLVAVAACGSLWQWWQTVANGGSCWQALAAFGVSLAALAGRVNTFASGSVASNASSCD